MKANETKLQPLIEGTKQYLVPLFQRPYSWERRQWQTLWKDIQELSSESGDKAHFMGAIVTMPAHTVPEGITKYLLIDGQQRVTTVLILLVALRDKAKEFQGSLADKIHDLYLINKYQDDLDCYKLLPTHGDREAFVALVESSQQKKPGLLLDAYHYFAKIFVKCSKEDIENLLSLVTTKLVFVSIVLAADDNAYVIFESLNFKGMPLTQADLIRNYFLMRVHVKNQEHIFNTYWKPIQDSLKNDQTEFIRHFLMMEQEQFVKKNEVYFTLKTATESLTQEGVVEYLSNLRLYSSFYFKLIQPEAESDAEIRRRLLWLKQLDITTAYPYLMRLYFEFAAEQLRTADFIELLDVLETFIVRRYICGVPTHGLNKFFPTLYSQIKEYPSIVDGAKEKLSPTCPRDAVFAETLRSRKIYGGGDRLAKARHLLVRFEESYGHKEGIVYDGLEIEHIMPQTLTNDWKAALGTQWQDTHFNLLDSLGNLTLTGFNPELSNLAFPDKRAIYAESHIEITKRVAQFQHWTEVEIQQRAAELCQKALEIWPYFGPTDGGEHDNETMHESLDEPAMTYAELRKIVGATVSINGNPAVFATDDGKTVLASCSKYYSKRDYCWYGITSPRLGIVESANCTHFAFGMGTKRVALVPADIIKTHIKACNTSLDKNGDILHYHVTIYSLEEPEIFFGTTVPRLPVVQYMVQK